MRMRSKTGAGGRDSHRRGAVWGGAAALMLVPVAVIRASEATAGEVGDFVFLCILLVLVGLAYEVAARVPNRIAYRAAAGVGLVTMFLSIWINLAVGIIGSEDDPANWLYAGVVAVAALGSALARFEPRGMVRAMLATAITQALVFVLALAAGLGFTGPITVFFTALWLISAWLFRRAAQQARSNVAAQ